MRTTLLFTLLFAWSTIFLTPVLAEDEVLPRETISELQRRLAQLGLYRGPADGIVGPQTRQVVRQYQKIRGLPVDGHITAELLRNLRDVGRQRDQTRLIITGKDATKDFLSADWRVMLASVFHSEKRMFSAIGFVSILVLGPWLMRRKLKLWFSNLKQGRAMFYCAKGHYEKAERLFKGALAIQEKVLGLEHKVVAKTRNNLGILYTQQGHYDEAARLFENALAIQEKVLGSEHLDLANTLNNLALLYAAQGRDNEAKTHQRLVLEKCETIRTKWAEDRRRLALVEQLQPLQPRVEAEKGSARG